MASVRHMRAVAQGLHRPGGVGVGDVVRRLLAVQAQDYRQAKLALRARTSGLTAADVDAAMDAREVVVTWVNRGTLHLMDRDDYPWLLGLTAPTQVKTVLKRLTDFDVDADLADTLVARIVAALAEDGPLDRGAIAARLAAARRPGEGLSVIHALGLSGLRGLTVRGPVVDGQQCYALTRDWLGTESGAPELDGETRERALGELARRYLRGHGPAGDRTSRSGRACRCATREPGWPRSRPSSSTCPASPGTSSPCGPRRQRWTRPQRASAHGSYRCGTSSSSAGATARSSCARTISPGSRARTASCPRSSCTPAARWEAGGWPA